MTRRPKTEYSEEFKKQMVELYNAGKPSGELIQEYKLTASTFYKWVKNYNQSGSFKMKDNQSEYQKQLKLLEKENKQLKMENDILKQAALIMGRK